MATDSENVMPNDPGLELLSSTVERVLPFRDSAAVVLRSEGKPFMIFVGMFEAASILREIRGEKTERPLTHDVISYVLTGFDIAVSRVVISSIVDGVFCGTLILRQEAPEPREVRLDIRASDSLVIALKVGVPIWITRRVLDQVEDVTEVLARLDDEFTGDSETGTGDDDEADSSDDDLGDPGTEDESSGP